MPKVTFRQLQAARTRVQNMNARIRNKRDRLSPAQLKAAERVRAEYRRLKKAWGSGK